MRRLSGLAAERARACGQQLIRAETGEIERGRGAKQRANLAAEDARMHVEPGGDLA